jgi:hypothetical protein
VQKKQAEILETFSTSVIKPFSRPLRQFLAQGFFRLLRQFLEHGFAPIFAPIAPGNKNDPQVGQCTYYRTSRSFECVTRHCSKRAKKNLPKRQKNCYFLSPLDPSKRRHSLELYSRSLHFITRHFTTAEEISHFLGNGSSDEHKQEMLRLYSKKLYTLQCGQDEWNHSACNQLFASIYPYH